MVCSSNNWKFAMQNRRNRVNAEHFDIDFPSFPNTILNFFLPFFCKQRIFISVWHESDVLTFSAHWKRTSFALYVRADVKFAFRSLYLSDVDLNFPLDSMGKYWNIQMPNLIVQLAKTQQHKQFVTHEFRLHLSIARRQKTLAFSTELRKISRKLRTEMKWNQPVNICWLKITQKWLRAIVSGYWQKMRTKFNKRYFLSKLPFWK